MLKSTLKAVVEVIDEEIERVNTSSEVNYWYREGEVDALKKLKKRIESSESFEDV